MTDRPETRPWQSIRKGTGLRLFGTAAFTVFAIAACASDGPAPGRVSPSAAAAQPAVRAGTANPPRALLYVGNSFMYYNNSLHNITLRIARDMDDPGPARHRATSVTISGAGLDWFDMTSLLAPDRIGRYSFVGDNEVRVNPPGRQYDSVLLMDCSQCPVHPTLSRVFFEYARKHAVTARAHGVEPMLLMTWGYADKPEMTRSLADAYTEAGRQNDAHVVPAGLAFAASMASRPEIRLIAADKRHPSREGSYLVAATMIASIWNADPRRSRFTDGLDPAVARHLQEVAWETTRSYHGR